MKIHLTDEQIDMIANRVMTAVAGGRDRGRHHGRPRKQEAGVDLAKGASVSGVCVIRLPSGGDRDGDPRLLTTLSDLRTIHTGLRSGAMAPREVECRVATLIDEIENSLAER